MLPQVRLWLRRSRELKVFAAKAEESLQAMVEPGRDLGGEPVDRWLRLLADLRAVMHEFQTREILLKDIDRGLLDFPAFIGSTEVFLCWQEDEERVEYWHDLDAGFAGRHPI